jgi:hypothetical protein
MLLANDTNGNVIGVTFTVMDNSGKPGSGEPLAIIYQPLEAIPGVSAGELAPIVAFQLNIVGPIDAQTAVLSSGAGTITYTASPAMTAGTSVPSACTETSEGTGEQANTVYGTLPTSPSNSFTQSFNISQ